MFSKCVCCDFFNLKRLGGPFTNAEEVKVNVDDLEISEKEKKVRMKMELQFARDSSTTLPQTDPPPLQGNGNFA